MSIANKFNQISFNTLSGYNWSTQLSIPEPPNEHVYLSYNNDSLQWTTDQPFDIGYRTLIVQIAGRGQYLDVNTETWEDFQEGHDLESVEFTFYTNNYQGRLDNIILASLQDTQVNSEMSGTDIRFLFNQSQLRPISLLINTLDEDSQPWTPIYSLTGSDELIGGNTRLEIINNDTMAIVLDYDDAVDNTPRDLAVIEQFTTTIIR